MKNKVITIEAPTGYEFDSFDQKNGKILLKEIPKDIKQLLQTDEDIYRFHGTTEEEFLKGCVGLRLHEIGRRKEEYMVAAYNGCKLPEDFDKLPDWQDGTAKGYPLFNMDSPSGSRVSFRVFVYWPSRSFVGSRQVFCGPDWKANLLDAVKKFPHIYNHSRTN